ncbi:MAG: FAD-dependent oxidoreductase [Pseudomonadales bacterium]|nr:FAD-dependent oxidoreductase [Pseudomonadales bacterium]
MRIAIAGAGISGLTAAWLLSRRHEVTVFEAEERIGGHTATVDVSLDGERHAIDTGFIVFNDRTYPNFIRLMDELGVASQPTEMSFSVSSERDGVEYAGSSLDSLFAQRGNLLRPAFWRMLRDILRFNRRAAADLEQGRIPEGMLLGDYLARNGYSREFRDWYLVPMGAAIWSSGTRGMTDFPVEFFVRFFRNHGLLTVTDQPQWRTIRGGSRTYLDPLTRRFAGAIRTNDPVQRITRQPDGVSVQTRAGLNEHFDHVVLGCHSDQALALLGDPSGEERGILCAIPYQENDVVLHTDTRVLPRARRAWSSWNYRLRPGAEELPVLSYDMNILQRLESRHTFCVTLNDTAAIDPERILGRYRYSHPVFSVEGVRAQQRWAEINGVRRTWFCGAWWANGFHEDGVTSALRVADALGTPW